MPSRPVCFGMKNRIMSIGCAVMMLLAISSCGQTENKNTGQLPDTDIVSIDTTTKASANLITDPVLLIRQTVEHINTVKLDSQHVEFMCDEKTKVDHFYEDGKVVKISVDFGWVGDVSAKEDYYYADGKLIFMYEYVEGGPACEGCIKKNEYRYYVTDGKVFKYLKDKKEDKCRKCEFGPKSRQVKLLTAKTTDEIKAIVCR